jgi:thiazole/oxazole-forming peptide maturase SagD family component
VSPSLARTAAICEAIERYCAVYRPDRPTVRATAAELGAAAIHPDAVLLFSEEQFSTREERNRSIHGTGLDVVPHRLPPDVPVRWAAGRSLVSGAELLLPASVAFFGHVDSDGPFFGTGEASGTATGSSVVEATVHALLELIERDSVGIWWYSQLSRPLLDVAEVSHSFVSRVAARLGGAGRSFWLLDVTADLGVPVVVAVSRCTDGPTEDLIFGFGAGLTLRSAAVRATAELAQFLPAVGERAADGRTRYRWPNDVGPRFWRNETLATQPQLAPHPTLRSPVQEPGPAEVDLHDVRDRLVADLAGHGLDPIVMDLTEPDVGLSAVRVTVPGLRHIWRRLGPGRLYDVPVQLGWLTTPRRERDLNPTDIFF